MEVAKKPCAPLVGADVEAFLYNTRYDRAEACVGILPGTKEKPSPLKGLRKGFAVQEDNVMPEFNIPPAGDGKKFATNIANAKKGVRMLLPEHRDLVFKPAMLFADKQLTSPQAKLIGCDPDFDAYQGGAMRRGAPPLTKWRNAGGHIHLGGDFQCPDFVAALFADLVVGLAGGTVGVRRSKRDLWYGRPGVYRPKPYGIEYRSPSCMWATSSNATKYAGHYAIVLAKWLTESDARDIQTTFRQINWSRVYGYLSFEGDLNGRENTKNAIITEASQAGAPV